MTRLLSMAAGVLPEFAPPVAVTAAAAGGWPACGVWFDPGGWDAAVEREVRARLDDTGLVALDMEPVFVRPDGDDGDRLVDAAAAVGAKNVLLVGRKGVSLERVAERMAQLADRVAGSGVTIAVEFSLLFDPETLDDALWVVREVDRANVGVLVDNLHVHRLGIDVAELARVDRRWLPYAQLCDGLAEPIDASPAGLRTDAVDDRVNVGQGALAVADVLGALPDDLPLSFEVRSAELRRAHPDPIDRARAVFLASTEFLDAREVS